MVLIIRHWTNNSNLSKILRLHAILRDAASSVFEFSEKRTGCSYLLPCSVTNEYIGHVTGLAFCFYKKTFKGRVFGMLECWNHEQLSLTEGFRNKSGFIVKELAIATEKFIDIIFILPPNSYITPSLSDQRSYQLISKLLHGIQWETGEYSFCYSQRTTSKKSKKFGDILLSKNWTFEIISRNSYLRPACTELPKKTEKQALRDEESPVVLSLFDEWIDVQRQQILHKFDSLQRHSARQPVDCNSSQGGKNWLSCTNNSEKIADCVWWRWNRSF